MRRPTRGWCSPERLRLVAYGSDGPLRPASIAAATGTSVSLAAWPEPNKNGTRMARMKRINADKKRKILILCPRHPRHPRSIVASMLAPDTKPMPSGLRPLSCGARQWYTPYGESGFAWSGGRAARDPTRTGFCEQKNARCPSKNASRAQARPTLASLRRLGRVGLPVRGVAPCVGPRALGALLRPATRKRALPRPSVHALHHCRRRGRAAAGRGRPVHPIPTRRLPGHPRRMDAVVVARAAGARLAPTVSSRLGLKPGVRPVCAYQRPRRNRGVIKHETHTL